MPPAPVLFFTTTPWLGGAERSMVELAGALHAGGRGVHGAFPPAGELAEAWQRAGLPWTPVAFPAVSRKWLQNPALAMTQTGAAKAGLHALAAALAAAAASDAQTPARVILQANSLSAALYSAVFLHLNPTLRPAANLWHCRDLLDRTLLGSSFAGAVFPSLTRAIAISVAVAQSLVGLGLPEAKGRLIRNGIPLPAVPADAANAPAPAGTAHAPAAAGTAHAPAPASAAKTEPVQRARREARAALGLHPNLPVALHVAQFTPWKKTALFLECCRTAAETVPLQVLLIGRDPAVAGLAAEASDEEDLPASIRLALDRLKQSHVALVRLPVADAGRMEQAYAAADVLVQTALREPFGRVVLEAMARGVAVLARGADGGGPAELLVHGATGWKVDHDDGFAPALVHLMQDDDLRRGLSRAGRAEASRIDAASGLAVHGTQRVAAQMEAVYRELGL